MAVLKEKGKDRKDGKGDDRKGPNGKGNRKKTTIPRKRARISPGRTKRTSKREPWSLQETPGRARRSSGGGQKSSMMAQDGTRRQQEEVPERRG